MCVDLPIERTHTRSLGKVLQTGHYSWPRGDIHGERERKSAPRLAAEMKSLTGRRIAVIFRSGGGICFVSKADFVDRVTIS